MHVPIAKVKSYKRQQGHQGAVAVCPWGLLAQPSQDSPQTTSHLGLSHVPHCASLHQMMYSVKYIVTHTPASTVPAPPTHHTVNLEGRGLAHPLQVRQGSGGEAGQDVKSGSEHKLVLEHTG